VGRVYLPDREYERVAGLAIGSRLGHVGELRDWDFYDMKGVVETLAEPFSGQGEWRVPAVLETFLHPGVQAEWVLDGRVIAQVGQLHPLIAREIGVDDSVFVFDIDLDRLLGTDEAVHKYAALAKFPAVQRDFAFLVDKDCTYADVEIAIRASSELLETVNLFDVYSGAQVPEGKQSYAVSVAYRSSEKTLTETDITAIDAQIVAEVEQRTGATLR
jgi:phenylalanyl-tRNA synthetase beta chain